MSRNREEEKRTSRTRLRNKPWECDRNTRNRTEAPTKFQESPTANLFHLTILEELKEELRRRKRLQKSLQLHIPRVHYIQHVTEVASDLAARNIPFQWSPEFDIPFRSPTATRRTSDMPNYSKNITSKVMDPESTRTQHFKPPSQPQHSPNSSSATRKPRRTLVQKLRDIIMHKPKQHWVEHEAEILHTRSNYPRMKDKTTEYDRFHNAAGSQSTRCDRFEMDGGSQTIFPGSDEHLPGQSMLSLYRATERNSRSKDSERVNSCVVKPVPKIHAMHSSGTQVPRNTKMIANDLRLEEMKRQRIQESLRRNGTEITSLSRKSKIHKHKTKVKESNSRFHRKFQETKHVVKNPLKTSQMEHLNQVFNSGTVSEDRRITAAAKWKQEGFEYTLEINRIAPCHPNTKQTSYTGLELKEVQRKRNEVLKELKRLGIIAEEPLSTTMLQEPHVASVDSVLQSTTDNPDSMNFHRIGSNEISDERVGSKEKNKLEYAHNNWEKMRGASREVLNAGASWEQQPEMYSKWQSSETSNMYAGSLCEGPYSKADELPTKPVQTEQPISSWLTDGGRGELPARSTHVPKESGCLENRQSEVSWEDSSLSGNEAATSNPATILAREPARRPPDGSKVLVLPHGTTPGDNSHVKPIPATIYDWGSAYTTACALVQSDPSQVDSAQPTAKLNVNSQMSRNISSAPEIYSDTTEKSHSAEKSSRKMNEYSENLPRGIKQQEFTKYNLKTNFPQQAPNKMSQETENRATCWWSEGAKISQLAGYAAAGVTAASVPPGGIATEVSQERNTMVRPTRADFFKQYQTAAMDPQEIKGVGIHEPLDKVVTQQQGLNLISLQTESFKQAWIPKPTETGTAYRTPVLASKEVTHTDIHIPLNNVDIPETDPIKQGASIFTDMRSGKLTQETGAIPKVMKNRAEATNDSSENNIPPLISRTEHIDTPSDEMACGWSKGISLVVENIRDTPVTSRHVPNYPIVDLTRWHNLAPDQGPQKSLSNWRVEVSGSKHEVDPSLDLTKLSYDTFIDTIKENEKSHNQLSRLIYQCGNENPRTFKEQQKSFSNINSPITSLSTPSMKKKIATDNNSALNGAERKILSENVGIEDPNGPNVWVKMLPETCTSDSKYNIKVISGECHHKFNAAHPKQSDVHIFITGVPQGTRVKTARIIVRSKQTGQVKQNFEVKFPKTKVKKSKRKSESVVSDSKDDQC